MHKTRQVQVVQKGGYILVSHISSLLNVFILAGVFPNAPQLSGAFTDTQEAAVRLASTFQPSYFYAAAP